MAPLVGKYLLNATPSPESGFLRYTMPSRANLAKLLKSRTVVFALLMGNIALGFTIFAQAQVIDGQKQLIHMLYMDSAELANMKIARNAANAKHH